MDEHNAPLSAIPILKHDMLRNGWIVTAFPMEVRGIRYAVVFEIYCNENPKPSGKWKFASVELTFRDIENPSRTLIIGANSFGIQKTVAAREFFGFSGWQKYNPWPNLYAAINRQIPEKCHEPSGIYKQAAVSAISQRGSERDPEATFCESIMRLGKTAKGEQKHRSIYNDNLTRLLRPSLYEKSRAAHDNTFSFRFRNPHEGEPEIPDEVLLSYFGKRN